MTSSPHWLPRATGSVVRGELVRRSFETRLEQRVPEEDEQAHLAWVQALESLERLQRTGPAELEALRTLLSLETPIALRAFVRLSADAQAAAAAVLSLPDEACELMTHVLSLPAVAADRLQALLGR